LSSLDHSLEKKVLLQLLGAFRLPVLDSTVSWLRRLRLPGVLALPEASFQSMGLRPSANRRASRLYAKGVQADIAFPPSSIQDSASTIPRGQDLSPGFGRVLDQSAVGHPAHAASARAAELVEVPNSPGCSSRCLLPRGTTGRPLGRPSSPAASHQGPRGLRLTAVAGTEGAAAAGH
jgi:hypothetical protein